MGNGCVREMGGYLSGEWMCEGDGGYLSGVWMCEGDGEVNCWGVDVWGVRQDGGRWNTDRVRDTLTHPTPL